MICEVRQVVCKPLGYQTPIADPASNRSSPTGAVNPKDPQSPTSLGSIICVYIMQQHVKWDGKHRCPNIYNHSVYIYNIYIYLKREREIETSCVYEYIWHLIIHVLSIMWHKLSSSKNHDTQPTKNWSMMTKISCHPFTSLPDVCPTWSPQSFLRLPYHTGRLVETTPLFSCRAGCVVHQKCSNSGAKRGSRARGDIPGRTWEPVCIYPTYTFFAPKQTLRPWWFVKSRCFFPSFSGFVSLLVFCVSQKWCLVEVWWVAMVKMWEIAKNTRRIYDPRCPQLSQQHIAHVPRVQDSEDPPSAHGPASLLSRDYLAVQPRAALFEGRK